MHGSESHDQKQHFRKCCFLSCGIGGNLSAPHADPTGSAPSDRTEEGKRQSFPLPRRAPTHTECGFKVLDPKGTG